jgi:hypothetical protein
MKQMNKVFKYGALSPLQDGAIRTQMYLGRKYYNNLVAAENARRDMKVWLLDTGPVPEDAEEKKEFYSLIRNRCFTAPTIDQKPLRAQAVSSGLYWGTYLMVEEAFNRAVSTTKYGDKVKFRSWRQGGYMGVQIPGSKNPDLKFLLLPAPDNRTGKKAGQRHTLQVRVGSEGRAPVWSEPLSLELHRPLEGNVTRVQICMKYRGDKEVWSAHFTCNKVLARVDSAQEGIVAIDVGWRTMQDGRIRIAYARGANGNEYELAMPESWGELSKRADRIRKHRDDMFNIIKEKFPVLKLHKKPRGARKKVLREGLQEDIELLGWVRWDKHMEDYELGCRRRSQAARQDAMRVWLRMLRRRYATAVIKDSEHKKMKDHEKAVKDGMLPEARRKAHHAAPGEVIAEICKIFGKTKGVALVEAPGTTATCMQCGAAMDVGAELYVYCEQCGARKDRDRVSTHNLLHKYFGGEYTKPTARKTTARFAKRHKNSDQLKQHQRDGL